MKARLLHGDMHDPSSSVLVGWYINTLSILCISIVYPVPASYFKHRTTSFLQQLNCSTDRSLIIKYYYIYHKNNVLIPTNKVSSTVSSYTVTLVVVGVRKNLNTSAVLLYRSIIILIVGKLIKIIFSCYLLRTHQADEQNPL